MTTYNDVLAIINANLQPGTNITAEEHIAVEESLADFVKSQWLTGDIKEIDCSDAYIAANFEQNGVGKNEREGWHICNGLNGTRNRAGRVSVGYGTPPVGTVNVDTFPTMLSGGSPILGGSKDAQIIDHTHEYQDAYMAESSGHKPAGNILGSNGGQDTDNGFFYRTRTGTGVTTPPAVGSRPLTDNPQSSTGSGTGKNMQPYIVTLFIQKL